MSNVLTEVQRKALSALSKGTAIGSQGGTLSISQRQAILQDLIKRGFVTPRIKITMKGLLALQDAKKEAK